MTESLNKSEGCIEFIAPQSDYLSGNPYRALVAFEEDFRTAEIRIEPPIHNTNGFLNLFAEGVDVNHVVTTAEATILSASRNVRDSGNRVFSDNEWIKYTTQQILNELGRVAIAALFTRNYKD